MLRQLSTAPAKAVRLTTRAATGRVSSSVMPSRLAAAQLSSLSFRTATAAARPARPFSSAFTRWYSSETETAKKDEAEAKEAKETKKEGEESKTEEAVGEPLSAADAAALRKELEAKAKEAVEWKDQYLRSVADFRNLQERTKREMKSARDFAITQFAKDLVDSVDNLDRALAMVPAEKIAAAKSGKDGKDGKDSEAVEASETTKDEAVAEALQDLINLVDGLRMTETILLQTLKKHGLERFDPEGEKFNPNEHEATFMTPNKEREHNTVMYTQQKGFRLNGRVLRAAKVGVVNNK